MLNIKSNQLVNRIVFALALGGVASSSMAETAAAADAARVVEHRGVVSRIEVFGDAFEPKPQSLALEQARVVFYRPDSASRNDSVSIFVNDSYHASLVGGGYSSMCTRASSLQLGFAHVRAGEKPRGARDPGVPTPLDFGKTLYLRVQEGGAGAWSLEPVAEGEARKELASTREQIHTISRVAAAEECRFSESVTQQVAPPSAPQAPLQTLAGRRG